MSSKDFQYSRLSGLFSIHSVNRRRSTILNDDQKESHIAAYTYKIRTAVDDVPVCQKALHGISKHRLNRILQSLVFTSKSPTDQRGHHGNKPT